ncbi:MAG: hypothetical protein Fur0022_09100 [Anaerolineales bacterium]
MNLDLMLTLLSIFVVLSGISFLVYFRSVQQTRSREANFKRAELERRAKKAVWAGATIVSARPHTASEQMQSQVRVDLTLQVQPPQGEPYTARTSWRVGMPLLSQFQPGQSISVKIDVDDPDLIFPNQPGVEFFSGLPELTG